MVNLDNVSATSYIKTLGLCSVISSFSLNIFIMQEGNILNIVFLFIPVFTFFIFLMSLIITIFPWMIIIHLISRFESKWIYVIGGIINASPFWGILFHLKAYGISAYFILLGAFCGWNYHRLLMKEKAKKADEEAISKE